MNKFFLRSNRCVELLLLSIFLSLVFISFHFFSKYIFSPSVNKRAATEKEIFKKRQDQQSPSPLSENTNVLSEKIYEERALPNKVYLGFAIEPITTEKIVKLEEEINYRFPIVMAYKQWGNPDNLNIDKVFFEPFARHSKIPLITWEPWDPRKGVDQPEYQLNKITKGDFDDYIRVSAQGVKEYGKPLFLRFAHEMNGNWYPWGGTVNGNSSHDYISSWIHIYKIFQEENVGNVTWVWSPDTKSYPDIRGNDLIDYFPGDEYVDWAGLDGYNWGPTKTGKEWQSFSSIFLSSYRMIIKFTSKPIMIAETASTEIGGKKSEWVKDAFLSQIPFQFPNIKALIWFNINKETNWNVDSSNDTISAFREAAANISYQTKPRIVNNKILSP